MDCVEGCAVYLDDVAVYSDEWGTHLLHLQEVFDCLAKAQLTVNLPNSEFAKATVVYLGWVEGQGSVPP